MEAKLRKTCVNIISQNVRGLSQQTKWTEREKKIHTVRPASLETRRSFSKNHNHEKFLFLTVLLLFAQCKIHYWKLVT
jgi:hypothetical protein